ncbi:MULTISPECIES: polyprenyl synthetase family protein [unclassified Croceitalea]|uniref:polyprenyl synthetase family protein n=1 Tax=unclassified Croceitalea TaxID=2632280 RepID=UPI0030D86992
MHSIEFYRTEFINHLQVKDIVKDPKNLYEPVSYILGLGGKRLRPVLTLLATDLFGGNYKDALDAAMAIEVFHNFSLVHDDIMDDAPLRRGKTTVHEKWDVNTGILSGDAMLINSYQFFENYTQVKFKELVQLFSKTAIEVCEGQQYDVDFETRDDVTIPEYLKMIEYKTAVLVATAMKMGAIIAGSSKENQELIYGFGKNLGIAFQLQDDYLDAFGDPKTFGKQIGGDIIENKKTFLYLRALELGGSKEKETLLHLYSIEPTDPAEKIEAIKSVFKQSGSVDETEKEIENYTQRAFANLEKINLPKARKEVLKVFGETLMKRTV